VAKLRSAGKDGVDGVTCETAPRQAERQDDRQREEGDDGAAVCEQRPLRRDLVDQGQG